MQNPGRLTLWIAYGIAQTYYDSGKFDMAVRCVLPSDSSTVDVGLQLSLLTGSSSALRRRIAVRAGSRSCIRCSRSGTSVRSSLVMWTLVCGCSPRCGYGQSDLFCPRRLSMP